MEDRKYYSFKCVIDSCQESGDKGYFGFPDGKPERLGKWLAALGMEAKPFASARVCFRHFAYPSDFYMSGNRPLKRGKLKPFPLLCIKA